MTPLRVENPIPEEAQNWRALDVGRGSDEQTGDEQAEIEARLQVARETWNGLSQEAKKICLLSLKMDDVSFERWAQEVADKVAEATPGERAIFNDKLRTYRQMRQELTDLIKSNPGLLAELQKSAPPEVETQPGSEDLLDEQAAAEIIEPIDLQRLGFTETTFQRLPTKEDKSGKTETFAFKRITGNHSWESGLRAAGNQLKAGIALGLEVKYPDKSQALHLLEKAKINLPANTSVGTFIDEPGGYIILHHDKPTTRTIAPDRTIDHYPNTEMMVLVVPDTKAAPSAEARPGKKVAKVA